jgi:hypothetical protein
MSSFTLGHFSQVCSQLLNHYYGEIVGQVGSYLLRRGNRMLTDIRTATGLSIREV